MYQDPMIVLYVIVVTTAGMWTGLSILLNVVQVLGALREYLLKHLVIQAIIKM
jgi:hypothetical protein